MTDAWCILRTGGASTLRLAQSLAHAGYDTWTPVEVQVKRDRRTKARQERIVAVMPTYVFASAVSLPDLVELALSVNEHPGFSVFRHYDRFPLVADGELAALKAIERKAAAENKPVVFNRGQQVKAPEGPYQGLTGQVVETSKGKFTLVAFPGCHIPVKFASWKLQEAA